MPELMATLKKDLAEVTWRELRIHMQRDVIIVVAENLDLVDTAVAVARDEKDTVQSWIASGEVAKPVTSQLERWENDLAKAFQMLIVKPFILIQEVSHG